MTAAWLGAVATITGLLIVGDVRRRHLDNRLVASLGLLALIGVAAIDDGGMVALGWVLMAATGVAAIGLALHGAGLVGGGDVKVAPLAVALITRFGADAWLVYLGVVTVVGAATGVVHLVRGRGRAGDGDGANIPLGPVLLAGLAPGLAVAVLAG